MKSLICGLLLSMVAADCVLAQGFLRVKTEANESPIRVEKMTVGVSVKGLYAAVDTEFVFRNPNGRVFEGELEFPLPDGAAVCGYAIDVNGVLTDGVVVKKEKARVVFETEARRKVDPGIVEHVKGNLYKTRIYPLPANGTRTVRVSYTTPLTIASNGDAALRLTMPREKIGKRKIRIEVDSGAEAVPVLGGLGDHRFEKAESFWRVSAEEIDAEPAEDVLVALPKLPPEISGVEKDSDGTIWFYASAPAPAPAGKSRKSPKTIDVIWDASGSRAGSERKLDLALLGDMPSGVKFLLIVFRNQPEPVREFASPTDLVAFLKDIPYDGGTDFEALAKALGEEGECRILFTDGLDTLSGKPVDFNGVKPIAVVSSMVGDSEGLRQACAGAVIDLQTTTVKDALNQIFNPPPRVSGVIGTGVADVQGIGKTALGRVTVIGRLTAPKADIKIAFGGGEESKRFHISEDKAKEGGTLCKAWAAMRIAQMTPRSDDFADELLEIGRKYGLVSPATSLIVLENLDQWVRHDIEPPESLPELRNQWRITRKGRTSGEEAEKSSHLAMLAKLWKERVEWLKRDFTKEPYQGDRVKSSPRLTAGEIQGLLERGAAASTPPLEFFAVASPAGSPSPPRAGVPSAGATGVDGDMLFADASFAGESGYIPARSAPGKKKDSASSAIEIKAWDPKTPYIDALKKSADDKRYDEYLKQKMEFGASPAFYLDCADFFFNHKETELGTKILTNLAEMKIEDAALLRVFAWRLRQAKQYELAVGQFRRLIKLRGEDPQSYRDLALTLAEWGKAERDGAKLEEAMRLYVKVAFTPWARHADTICLFALEELNALIAWIDAIEWKKDGKPSIPEFDTKFREALSTDLRIMIAWDADNTDIDLHVVEPGGEEAFYSHNRTEHGGLVSRDITDGYGPEEYLIAKAPHGEYAIFSNYFASHQQTVLGPATVTATVFTDWGRAEEKQQTLSIRLDTPKDKIPLGNVMFGKADGSGRITPPKALKDLAVGMMLADAEAILGEAVNVVGATREYPGGSGSIIKVQYAPDGKLIRAERHFPGGAVMILAQ